MELFDFMTPFAYRKGAKKIDDPEYPYCIKDHELRFLMWDDTDPKLDEAFVLTK